MTRLQALKKEALSLTDAERAVLASDILQTLPAVLSDEDEGIAEALRRDAEWRPIRPLASNGLL